MPPWRVAVGKTGGLGESLGLSKEQAGRAPESGKGHHEDWQRLPVYPACLKIRVAIHVFHGGSKWPERLSCLSGVSGGGEAKISPQHEATMPRCQNPHWSPFGS